jgi:hypothetical protein
MARHHNCVLYQVKDTKGAAASEPACALAPSTAIPQTSSAKQGAMYVDARDNSSVNRFAQSKRATPGSASTHSWSTSATTSTGTSSSTGTGVCGASQHEGLPVRGRHSSHSSCATLASSSSWAQSEQPSTSNRLAGISGSSTSGSGQRTTAAHCSRNASYSVHSTDFASNSSSSSNSKSNSTSKRKSGRNAPQFHKGGDM